jgi:hypothetical protein
MSTVYKIRDEWELVEFTSLETAVRPVSEIIGGKK